MRAILIDPFEKEVREIDWSGKYHDISNILDCQYFDVAYIGSDDGDVIYVDDEGLFREKGQEYFAFAGHPHPLAGYGLLVGTDAEGETVAPKMSIDWVTTKTFFLGDMGGNPPRPQITVVPWGND